MDKRYQIFISAAHNDLEEERSKVMLTILRENHFPICVDLFKIDDVERWDQIKRIIDGSDYFILIIKRRYGTLTEEQVSIAEKEYDYARSQGISVLAFVSDKDMEIPGDDIEQDPHKTEKLNIFIKKVTESPWDSWNSADDLCTKVSSALHNQFETNPQGGWVKTRDVIKNSDLPDMDEESVLNVGKEAGYDILRRYGDVSLSRDFLDVVDENMLEIIKRSTYIRSYIRTVELNIKGSDVEVTVTNNVKYKNVCKNFKYYYADTNFPSMHDLKTYEHLIYEVNGKDLLGEINEEITRRERNNTKLFFIKNNLPLDYSKEDATVLHKVSYVIPIERFFQDFHLLAPCMCFLLVIVINEEKEKEEDKDVDDQYVKRIALFPSFNTQGKIEAYAGLYTSRADVFDFGDWSLPGVGYALTLQKKIRDDEDEPNEECNDVVMEKRQ